MRVIRPLNVARLLALLLAFGVCIPSVAAEGATKKKTTRTVAKPAYSASASQARKARLARARVAARAREQARVQALQEAMRPRFKTDATGALVPDIRAVSYTHLTLPTILRV